MKKSTKLLLLTLIVLAFGVSLGYGQHDVKTTTNNEKLTISYKDNGLVMIIETVFEKSQGYMVTDSIEINPQQSISLFSISADCDENVNDGRLFYQRQIKGQWSDWIEMDVSEEHGDNSNAIRFEGEFLRVIPEMIKFKAEGISQVKCSFNVILVPAKAKTSSLQKEKVFFNEKSLGCDQPIYVSQNSWCSLPSCGGTNPVPTSPITHIIVHHQGNFWPISPPYVDIINQIYLDHTGVENYDNIGYNWLIDPDGIIYEGTPEGIKGSHFSCMNSNTVGICLLGNYSNSSPSVSALNSLKRLTAYLAENNGIDVNSSSLLTVPNIVLNNLSGHRDGNPFDYPGGPSCTTTVCPGNNLYSKLQEIRNDVTSLIASGCDTSSINCVFDPYEVNGVYLLPNNQSNLTLNSSYKQMDASAYICEDDDLDRYTFEITHKGSLYILLNELPANYELELYKNNILVDYSINNGTNEEAIVYDVTSNATDTYTIAVFGNGYQNGNGQYSTSQKYNLEIAWIPEQTIWESLWATVAYASTTTNLNVCQNQPTQLQVTPTANCPNIGVTWTPSDGLSCTDCFDPIVTTDVDRTYSVYTYSLGSTNANDIASSCFSVQDVSIFVTPGGVANAGSDEYINTGGSVQLNGSGGVSYSWSPSTGLSNVNVHNPIASPTQTTTYTLTTSQNNCFDTDQMTVIVNGTTGSGGSNSPPQNDNCNGAISLTSSTNCIYTSGTVDFATSDGFPTDPSCDYYSNPNGYGVFYSFVATSNSHTIHVNPTGTLDAVITVYSGTNCYNLTELDCDDTPQTGSATITNNNFVIGQQYWIRVYDYGSVEPPIGNGGFNICVTHNSGGTGSGPDLVSNITNISNTNPNVGDLITVTVSVTNTGSSPINNSFAVASYISTNQIWSTGDTYISGGTEIISSLGVGQTTTYTKTISVPNLSDGQYYFVSVPDVSDIVTEANEGNNESFHLIQIGSYQEIGPNLDVKDLDITPGSGLALGQEFNVEFRVKNEGNEDSNNFDCAIIWDMGNDGTYNPGIDIVLKIVGFNDLDAGDSKTKDRDCFVPQNLTSTGTYQIIVIADWYNDINETDEGDNDKDDPIHVATLSPALPDLVINHQFIEIDGTTQVVNENSLCMGVEYEFNFQIENIGTFEAASGGQQIRARGYISTDQIIDGSDNSIGTVSCNTQFDPGETLDRTEDHILEGYMPGNYYLLLEIDYTELISELDETNNVTVVPITILNCNNELLPDLDIVIDNLSPYQSELGDSVYIDVTITNIGDAPANNFNVKAVVSDDNIYHGDGGTTTFNDHVISGGYLSGLNLQPNSSISVLVKGYTRSDGGLQPPITNTGIYYVFVEADENQELNEYNKVNNIASTPIELTSVDCYFNLDSTLYSLNPYPWYQDTYPLTAQVLTEDTCIWVPTSNENWISVSINSNGFETGPGYIGFVLDENPFPIERSGYILINGAPFYQVNQEAKSCDSLPAGIKPEIDLVAITDIECENYGAIDISPMYGVPPYSFSWNNSQSSEDLDSVSNSGIFIVTMTDYVGCQVTESYYVGGNSSVIDTSIMLLSNVLIANENNATYQWVDCLNNNQPIIGETNQQFVVNQSGEYAVTLEQDSCTVISSCIVVDLADISDNELSSIEIYPNPTSGTINISNPENIKIDQVLVRDIRGRLIREQSFLNEISLREFSAGTYFVTLVQRNDHSISYRVIKE